MGLAASSSAGGCSGRLSHAVTGGGYTSTEGNGSGQSSREFEGSCDAENSGHREYIGFTGSSSGGQVYSGGDVIRRCNCYSMSLDRKCCRHSLTFSAAHSGLAEKAGNNSRTKKKRSYGFATFKKKLIGKRRHCKGSDHGRCFREHFVDCPSDTLKALSSQYESLTMLRDLSVQANLARPPAATLGQSLAELFSSGICSDITLVYRGHRIPAHRTILMARCPYFSRHLTFSRAPEFALRTRHCVVSPLTLKRLLTFLYTGQPELLATSSESEASSLATLEEEFGIPNSLESDAAFLIDSGSLADCKIVFTGESDVAATGAEPALEITCHKTILAARSGFFRRLLERRKEKEIELSKEGLEIVQLDNDIIPAKYGYILIHAMYVSHSFRDDVFIKLVAEVSNSVTSLTSNPFQTQPNFSRTEEHTLTHSSVGDTAVPSTTVGSSSTTVNPSWKNECNDQLVKDIMNLYEIGRFLEFNFLSQNCEDVLMQLMTTQNVIDILSWSLQPHGSSWVARQAYQYLEEEFSSLSSNTELLGKIDEETLVRILKSDFTQASESELLKALIRWGEQQFKSKNKDYATGLAGAVANPLSSSNSTTSRKTAKRNREICDSELKELLANIFPHVRIQHILPRDRNSEILDMALARNLFPFHPLSNFASQSSSKTKFAPWDPRNTPSVYTRPRLFLPYFEECKNIIQERCVQDPEIISSSSPRLAGPPDTLYMLRNQMTLQKVDTENTIDYDTSRLPDNEMISKMLERLEKLLNGVAVQRAMSVRSIVHEEVVRLVELRVVRECNLPDNYTTFLDKMRNRLIKANNDEVELSNNKGVYSKFSTKDLLRHEDLLMNQPINSQGPDVTLATNAISSLSFNTTRPKTPNTSARGSVAAFSFNKIPINSTSTSLCLESVSPDLVSVETKDGPNICQAYADSKQMKHFTKNKASSIYLSEANLGVQSFQNSVESSNLPSTLLPRNVGSWKASHHASSEMLIERGRHHIVAPPIHQQEHYSVGIQSQSSKQSHSVDLMSHDLQPEHDGFIQNVAAQDASPNHRSATTKPDQRMSQNYSTNPNSSTHMYL